MYIIALKLELVSSVFLVDFVWFFGRRSFSECVWDSTVTYWVNFINHTSWYLKVELLMVNSRNKFKEFKFFRSDFVWFWEDNDNRFQKLEFSVLNFVRLFGRKNQIIIYEFLTVKWSINLNWFGILTVKWHLLLSRKDSFESIKAKKAGDTRIHVADDNRWTVNATDTSPKEGRDFRRSVAGGVSGEGDEEIRYLR